MDKAKEYISNVKLTFKLRNISVPTPLVNSNSSEAPSFGTIQTNG